MEWVDNIPPAKPRKGKWEQELAPLKEFPNRPAVILRGPEKLVDNRRWYLRHRAQLDGQYEFTTRKETDPFGNPVWVLYGKYIGDR